MAPRTPKAPETKPAKAEKPTREKAGKPAARAKAAKAETAVAATQDVDAAQAAGGLLKLKDLIDSVAAKTGGKKPDVKAAVEATLAALGEALATGKALAVPPLGKLRVVKNKGPAMTLKLRLADGAKAAGLALADDGEDG